MATPRPGGRFARALVLGGDGDPLGCLPTIELGLPWWQETGDLLAALKQRFDLDAVVLRLLGASAARFEPGAEVTYAVEALGDLPSRLPLAPCEGIVLGDDSDPLRMPWARVGGVASAVAWADRELAALGRRRTGPAEQMRSWNLSLLVRLATDAGTVWLKQVPPFLRHESSVIALVREFGAAVPDLLASDPGAGLALLDDVPGEDTYFPNEYLTIRMVESLVVLQRRMTARRDAILAAGAPDWSGAMVMREASRLVTREDVRAELEPGEQEALEELISNLGAKLDALHECGLQDTLVHGDFHPGNHRFDGHRLVLLDWGDSGVGHPLLDMTAFIERVPLDRLDRVRAAWLNAWRNAYPYADVSRAAMLIRSIAALQQALIYRRFLDGIEASERIYHAGDPATWLRRAIRARDR